MTSSAPYLGVFLAIVAFVAPAYGEPRRVAVLDFANMSKDPAIEWLGPAVAETITTKLHAVRMLQLVERLQLYRVLQEQKLSLSDLVDPSRAVQIGKLLGAEQVVIGGYSAFGSIVRFTARFVDVATGMVVAASQVDGLLDRGNPKSLFDAFDSLAQATIDSLNTRAAIVQGMPQAVPTRLNKRIEPTFDERARLAKAPTNSLEAHEAFGQALVFYLKHRWTEAAREFERATSLDPGYGQAWQFLGRVLYDLGQSPQALQAQQMAYRLFVRLGDEPGQAATLNNLGAIRQSQGRPSEALSYYERSLRLSEKLGNELLRTATLKNIGDLFASQGRFSEALSYYERSLRFEETSGDEPGQAVTLNNIGLVYGRQGRFVEALSYYERSLRLKERLGDEPGQARTINNIGAVRYSQSRYSEALSYYERSLQLNERWGDERGQAAALNNIGEIHMVLRRYVDALKYFELGLRLDERLGNEWGQSTILSNIGSVYREQGLYREALSYYQRSLRLDQKLGNEPGQAVTLNNIGVTYANSRRYAEALKLVERALEIAERLGMAERDAIRRTRDDFRSRVR